VGGCQIDVLTWEGSVIFQSQGARELSLELG
jgi:hypothetical protein